VLVHVPDTGLDHTTGSIGLYGRRNEFRHGSQGAADFDLELIESRTLDGNIQELIYRPTLHA
jgi:hypothetical protein